jgi:hypothetical protein
MTKNKFILIDNSIADVNGHHFQYAVHCLKAAESLGLEPILVTNKKYKNIHNLPWKIIPLYHHGFWFEKKGGFIENTYNFFLKIRKCISNYHIKRKIKIRYSIVGLYYEIKWMLPTYFINKLDNQPTFKESKAFLLVLIFFLGLPLIFTGWLQNIISKLHISSKIKELSGIIITLSKTQPIDPITGSRLSHDRTKTFATDTKMLFHSLTISDGDHVFIPTTGATEMLGLSMLFENYPESRKPIWHLLYRRNLYVGSKLTYKTQRESIRTARNVFQFFFNKKHNARVYFYTDTEDLSYQYNTLGIVKFSTLPIPHTHPLTSNENSKKLRITYLGDARTEKGYHFLPKIMRDLTPDYVLTDRIEFHFQSNFNIPGGELKPKIAYNELLLMSANHVKLYTEPMLQDEYEKLLLNSHIILLPYDQINYSARSSGILAESLASGIPVLVPAGTWLSRQFQHKIYEYHFSILLQHKPLLTISEFKWKISEKNKRIIFKNDIINFKGHQNRIGTLISVPQISTHCLVEFEFANDPNSVVAGGYVKQLIDKVQIRSQEFYIEKVESTHCSLFVHLQPKINLLVLELKNPENDALISISNLKVHFFNFKETKIPLSVIGGIYRDSADMSFVLKDIVDNYLHYRHSAQDYGKKYYAYHNADNLIRQLVDRGGKM